MKKTFITSIIMLWVTFTYGQLTGTKQIPGDYATLAEAITDLNTQGVGPGGVIIELTSGTSEVAPVGGYVITATGTSDNPIIIKGNDNTITSNNSLTPGALNDAFFKIIGGDYITIEGFVMQESTNNTTTTSSSNNMTEFGVALFYSSPTDGPQNCTIQNNTITLGTGYQNAFGIYATSMTDANNMTTTADITSSSGAFNNLKILNNIISSVNLGVVLVGSASADYMASNIEVIGNNITFGRTSNFSSYIGVSAGVYGIGLNSVLDVTINSNTILCNATNTNGILKGIYHYSTGTLPTSGASFVNNYKFNTINLINGTTTFTYGIHLQNLNNLFTTYITDNTINNLNYNVISSASVYGIYHEGASLHQYINNNILNLNTNTSGTVYAINGGNTIPENGTQTVQNNRIQIIKSEAGATVYGYYSSSLSPATVVKNISNNIMDSVVVTGATTVYAIYDKDGYSSTDAPTKNIYSNIIKNFTGGTSEITLISTNYDNNVIIYDNIIEDISNQAGIKGIVAGGNSTTSANVYNNILHNFTTTSGSINGIVASANATGSISNIYANTIYNFEASSSSSSVIGISVTGGSTTNVYNNFVKELYTPNASNSMLPSIAGITLINGTNSNLYYNTVYLDATSTGADFSTCALYATTTPNVKLINNILVNNSTSNGTGMTIVFRRNETSLSKYDIASNNNCLYCDDLSVNNVIYYDGTNSYSTLGSLINAVSPRETASISELPPFVNINSTPYDIHIQTGIATGLESGGISISGINNDIDNEMRYGGSGYVGSGVAPDIGADEFNGITNFTCTTPNPGNTIASDTLVCFNAPIDLSLENTISGTGIFYQWRKSNDGISYVNIPQATNSTLTGYAITEPVFFTCAVTCMNGPETVYSNPIFVDLANKILTTTDDTICGAGYAYLTATATSGSTIDWYDSPVGGNLLDTGSTFITPLITSNTSYYVAAETFISTSATIGTGSLTSASYESPFYHLYGALKSQYLIRESELHAAGLHAGIIKSLSYEVVSPGTTYNDLNVSVGTTTDSVLTNTFISGLTNVYYNATYTPVVGVNTITFTTPIMWDGISNIVIEFCWSNNNSGGTSTTVKYDNTTYISQSYNRVDNQLASDFCDITNAYSTQSKRPMFTFTEDYICSSPRVEVIATVDASSPITISDDVTVCNDAITSIDVIDGANSYSDFTWTPETNLYIDSTCTIPYSTSISSNKVYFKSNIADTFTYICYAFDSITGCGATDTVNITVLPATITISANPDTICTSGSTVISVTPTTGFGTAIFQFSESFDGITFNDIQGANGFTYTTGILDSNTYYRWTAFVGNEVCIQEQILVSVLHPQVLSTTDSSHCGTGSVTLSATGSAGTTLNWFDAPSGGNLVGTGTNFTTPPISSTTSYYVEANIMIGNPATIGNGTQTSTGNESPFYHFYGGKKSQYLILASDLQAAGLTSGTINSLSFEVVSAGESYQDFNLSLGSTAANAMTTTFVSGLTNVYSDFLYTPVVGPNVILFTTPYYWDGISNIVVEFCWSNNNNGGTTTKIKYDATSYPSEAYYSADYQNASTLCSQTNASSTINALPKFTFTSACISPRTEVVATITPAPPVSINSSINDICAGDTVTLTAQSSNNNYTYSWNTGDSGQIITVNPTSPTTFSVTATDPNTGCVTTAEIDINVYPLPNVTATVDNSTITCGQSVQLTGGELYTSDVINENFNGTSHIFTPINTSTGGTPSAAAWTLRPDGYVYLSTTFHSNDSSQFIMSNSDAQGNGGTTHTELISPVFSSVGVDSITIEMYHYFRSYNGTAKVEVFDGNQWNNIQTWNTNQGSATNFAHVVIPLTNNYLNNSNLQIRFVYDAAWGYYWAIDNVNINLYHANTFSWTSIPVGFTSTIYNPVDTPVSATQYNLVVTNVNGCTNTANVNVSVNNMPAPSVTVNNFCGESELIVSNYSGTIQWSTGETTDTIIVFNNYTVSVFYSDSICISDSAIVMPDPIEIPLTPTVNPVSACYAEPVDAFVASSDYNNFIWFSDSSLTTPIATGSTFQSPEVNVGTYTYYVVALNDSCASNPASAVLNIYPLPTVSISQDGDTLYSSSNTGNQWYNSTGAITGATDSVYVVTEADDYYVVVTDTNGCSAMSNTIHVVPTTISNNIVDAMISVMPNPTHGEVTITLGKINNANIQIVSADGKIVYNTNINKNHETIQLNNLVSGIYTVKIITNNKTIQKKLIVE